MNTELNAPDLTQRPPRSARVRLDGYAVLPRILDKARAALVDKAGEYRYGNPTDQNFFNFTGITQDALLERVKTGAGDWEIALWIRERARPRRAPHEIHAWSEHIEAGPIGDAEDLEWFAGKVKGLNSARDDLRGIIDYLDLDDYVSFGGKA